MSNIDGGDPLQYTDSHSADDRSSPSLRSVLLIVIPVLGAMLTVTLFLVFRDVQDRESAADFHEKAGDRIGALEDLISQKLTVIRAMEAFFNASASVGRDEFATCADQFLNDNPDIVALGFAPRVLHADRNDYEVRARRDGMEAFQITANDSENRIVRAGDRNVYFPIYYIDPFTPNEHMMGLDLLNDPVWRTTMQASCDSKSLKATPPFRGANDSGAHDRCLILTALYNKDGVDYTIEGRRKNLQGYVGCVVSCNALVQAATGDSEVHDVDTELADITDDSSPWTLFEQGLAENSQRSDQLLQDAVIEVGGREWRIRCRPTPMFFQARGNWTPWMTLLLGLALTVLLTLYLNSQLSRTRQIEAEVRRRTTQLIEENRIRKKTEDELHETTGIIQATFDSLQDGLYVLSNDLTIRHVNRTIERWYGGEAPFLGQKCYTCFRGNSSPCQPCPAKRCLRSGSTESEIIEDAAATGQWFEIICQPIFDERNGTVVGLVELIRDITERKQAEAKQNLLQEQLITSSRQAGMAEVATGVLHNVGNVLNSVNVSAQLLTEKTKGSHVAGLSKATALIEEHLDDLATFITADSKGQHLPDYLCKVSSHLLKERDGLLDELTTLVRNVEHIKEIVSRQQSYAVLGGVAIEAAPATLADDALKTYDGSLPKYGISVERKYDDVPRITTDKHKVLQILINLISNAKHALIAVDHTEKLITVRVEAAETDRVVFTIADNGIGIAPDALARIFNHGFTTKQNGHGFGLHSSALAAKELGGALTASSAGTGQGAEFRLELPSTSPCEGTEAPSNAGFGHPAEQSPGVTVHSHA